MIAYSNVTHLDWSFNVGMLVQNIMVSQFSAVQAGAHSLRPVNATGQETFM